MNGWEGLLPLSEISPFAWTGWFDTGSVEFGAVNLPDINAAADVAEYILEEILLVSGTPVGIAGAGLALLSVKLARTVLNEKLSCIYGIKVTQLNQQDYPYELLMRFRIEMYYDAAYNRLMNSEYTDDFHAA